MVRRSASSEHLLGHTLTTITVKAGLARHLGETDPARSQQEIAEVEDLARRSLADVRAAVAKTGSRNRTEAVRSADERGWL